MPKIRGTQSNDLLVGSGGSPMVALDEQISDAADHVALHSDGGTCNASLPAHGAGDMTSFYIEDMTFFA